MNEDSQWLPDLIVFSDYDGDWNAYVEALYAAFGEDFLTSQPNYPNKRWAVKRHPLIREKEATFWHIISEGNVESERLPNLRRCECIRWPRAMIDAMSSGQVRVWGTTRSSEKRVLIALPDFSYLVVLADRGDYIMLWTAYCVEKQHQRRKLEGEYGAYIKRLASSSFDDEAVTPFTHGE